MIMKFPHIRLDFVGLQLTSTYNLFLCKAVLSLPACFVLMLIIVLVLHRLVNENEVKQWRDQAEKFRKGETSLTHTVFKYIFAYKI